MKKGLLVLIVCIYASVGCAQIISFIDSCNIRLTLAQKSFEKGNFEDVVLLLQKCLYLNHRYSKSEGLDALRMLAISQLFLGDNAKTDTAIKLLLKRNPQYLELPNPADPAEFSKLVSQYRVQPKASLGLSLGLHRSRTIVFANYQPSGSATSYLPVSGNDIGIEYIRHYGQHLQLGLMWSSLRVNYHKYMPNVNGWNEQNIERLRYNTIGLTGQYGIWLKKIRPFIGISIQASYLKAALSEISYKLISDSSVEVVNDIDTRSFRHSWQYWVVPTAGVTFPVADKATISVGAYYAFGLRNVVNPDNRYSSSSLIFNHYYLDDDFRFQLPGIRLSFLHTISSRVVKKN